MQHGHRLIVRNVYGSVVHCLQCASLPYQVRDGANKIVEFRSDGRGAVDGLVDWMSARGANETAIAQVIQEARL